MADLPKKARETVAAALEAGWSFLVRHEKDSGGSPLVTVQAVHPWDGRARALTITWHTRDTGT